MKFQLIYRSRQSSFLRCLVLPLLLGLCFGLIATPHAYAAFGVTSSGGVYTVDTGAGLVFKVNAGGGITSLKYKGTELQDSSKTSAIASGFFVYGSDTVTVTPTTYGTTANPSTNYIKLTVTDTAPTGSTGQLIHYYIVRNGVNNIYMATYLTQEPSVGELRYIMRLLHSQIPNVPGPSDLTGTTGNIESTDVFGFDSTASNSALIGQSRSKYYGRDRAMDLGITGVSGTGVGVYMIYGNRESSSGGPFYRDIQNQSGTDSELYNYMNSGHEQTEAWRANVLNGPYIYAFTDGPTPTLPIDTSWISGLGLTGWVDPANRGSVTGQATGIPAGFQGVVGFANTTAQYWCTVANDASYTSPLMIPGTYTMTLYKGELAVATGTVTVPLSATPVTQNIAAVEPTPFYRWRIGEWDGTPAGFLNADKIIDMHPSDVRMSSWGPITYAVGTSTPDMFPCYQWVGVNNPNSITFNLTADQLVAHTLRIGITCAYAGGRPNITVNNNWTPKSLPAASSQPNSRSMTVGTYRGNNATYTYSIPASAFVVGTNTISVGVISGSSGTAFLSPGYAYDALELDVTGTASVQGAATLQGWTGAPQPLTFTLTPTGSTTGGVLTQKFTPAADSSFTLSSVPAGTYTLGIKGARWLQKDMSINTTGGNVTGLSAALFGGDVNGDGVINGADISAASAAFRSRVGDANWNAAADVNGDGVVNGADISLISANFRKRSDP